MGADVIVAPLGARIRVFDVMMFAPVYNGETYPVHGSSISQILRS